MTINQIIESNSDIKSLILLRGLPGSGKSTLATFLSIDGGYPLFSVDDYFTNPQTGEYHFKFDENYLAYKQCEQSTEASMKLDSKKIFVHNTFTLDWEMEPYFKLAKQYDYRIYVLTVENYHNTRNIHDVGDEQIRKMAEKYKIKLF